MNIKVKFKFGQRVIHIMNEREMMIVGYQITWDKKVIYGTTNGDGAWQWFREYELVSKDPEKPWGFIINIEENGSKKAKDKIYAPT